MKVSKERWNHTGHECRPDSRPIGEDVLLCVFDEGFLLGFEAGVNSVTPDKAVKMTLTPSKPRRNT